MNLCICVGMDTGVVQKESDDSQPNFMRFFAQEDQQKKVGRKQPIAGPQNISYYFPDIPEGMDLRDFVRDTHITTSPIYHPNLSLSLQLKTLTVQQLEEHMSDLDKYMDQELEALR